MNWFKKIVLSQTGEFWITDNGQAYYADGDIGDMNHEMYIIEMVLAEKDLNFDEIDIYSISEEEFQQLGFTPEQIDVLLDRTDARDYGLEHYGWKRVLDTNVQTQTLTSGDLDIIASGLYEAYDEQVLKSTFNIEVNATGKYYTNVPYKIIEAANPMALREYMSF